ncbi:response regulator [Rhizobacter sp. J219]|jgi:CheY-like chemotaxis protein|uniref:response regulator n=1 Tax=Rhizobacter sp. J219 TaxID=2898430 RepID=UPI002151F03A|nr:response regulator [Rhizobacter sp. J219]MCR5883105.1 response regulator [Rhizobacter sp. J219]
MLDLVMVVDDNDADLVYTEVVLRARGIAREVSCYDTAAAALSRLTDRAQPPVSLVLLDLNMPEMDGFAFLRAYESQLTRAERPVPVIMLSSSPESSDRLRCTAHGCVQGYMVKPLSDEDARQLLTIGS